MHQSGSRQLYLTTHAQERCQQRGIDRAIVETVHRFGKRQRSRDGFSYAMDKNGHRNARMELGELAYRRIADKLNCYIVVAEDEETVITVAHRIKPRKAA